MAHVDEKAIPTRVQDRDMECDISIKRVILTALVPAGVGVRKENDTRWANYLSTCVAYYYNAGITQGFYDEFMAFRGLAPGRATAIQREAW